MANVPELEDAGEESPLLSPRASPVTSLMGGVIPQSQADSVPSCFCCNIFHLVAEDGHWQGGGSQLRMHSKIVEGAFENASAGSHPQGRLFDWSGAGFVHW